MFFFERISHMSFDMLPEICLQHNGLACPFMVVRQIRNLYREVSHLNVPLVEYLGVLTISYLQQIDHDDAAENNQNIDNG